MSLFSRRDFLGQCLGHGMTLWPALSLAGCASHTLRHRHPQGSTPDTTDSFLMPDGVRLPVRVWRAQTAHPSAIVLALHGFNDSRDAWEYPAPFFTAANMMLFAPDQRGFGQAPGRGGWAGMDRMVADVHASLALLRQRYPDRPLILVGESMGGAIAMLTAAQAPSGLPDRTVVIAPAIWGRAQMDPAVSAMLWMASRGWPRHRVTGDEIPLHIVACDNRAALIRLRDDPLTLFGSDFRTLAGLVDLMDAALAVAPRMPANVLFQYGAHDQVVPAQAMTAMWRTLPPHARRALYAQGYHLLWRDKNRPFPIQDALHWMVSPDEALLSSAEIAAAAWMAGGAGERDAPLFP